MTTNGKWSCLPISLHIKIIEQVWVCLRTDYHSVREEKNHMHLFPIVLQKNIQGKSVLKNIQREEVVVLVVLMSSYSLLFQVILIPFKIASRSVVREGINGFEKVLNMCNNRIELQNRFGLAMCQIISNF